MDTVTLALLALVLVAVWLTWRLVSLERKIVRLAEAPPASLQLLQSEVQAIRSGVDERLGEQLRHSHEISRRLGELLKAMQQVERVGLGLDELQKILRPPGARGAFGERLLEHTLADVLPRDRFRVKYTYPKSGVCVDVAILLGQNRVLPIDSKFPLENFRRYLDRRGSDDADADKARRDFVRDVRRHVDDIADKYLSPEDGTLDVAFMYIPSESVFHEVAVAGPDADGVSLAEYALRRGVVPVSPNTLHAYLSVVRMGLRGFELQERTREVLESLTHLHSEMETLRSELGLAIKQARHSLSNLEEAEVMAGRLSRRLEGIADSGAPGDRDSGASGDRDSGRP
jgi:DNA recombination protein RmuC